MLIFNQHKLNQIDKKIEDILSKNNPQVLLKSEQLRKGKNQIKLWVSSMAEKQGLFTHLVNPDYTNKKCSQCHLISHLNRLN